MSPGTSGVITVAAGTTIDASAQRPGDRLVRVMRSGVVNYSYVEGDLGGIVTLRAPVISDGTRRSTVNVSAANANSIVGGARDRPRRLQALGFGAGRSEQFLHGRAVQRSDQQDHARPRGRSRYTKSEWQPDNRPRPELPRDNGPGTVVDFVQNFNLSPGDLQQSRAVLLHSRTSTRGRGIDLAATGDIVLNSTWNLGAGTVNLSQAVTDGLAVLNPMLQRAGELASGYVIKSGAESKIFDQYTKLTYRTNHGDVRGEAAVLSLRAGGALDIKGSLSDGFFVFRDQSDKTYRQALNKTYNTNYILTLNGGFSGFGNTNSNTATVLTDWSTWVSATGTAAPTVVSRPIGRGPQFAIQRADVARRQHGNIPYSPMGNSPAALGSYKTSDGLGNIDGGRRSVGQRRGVPAAARQQLRVVVVLCLGCGRG